MAEGRGGRRMDIRELRDKEKIEAFLRGNRELHIYCIGDLDDFFWPHTRWLAWEADGEVREVVLIYTGRALPTVIEWARSVSRPCRGVLPARR